MATSKPEHFARKILDLFDLAKYFDFVAGAIADKIRDKKWEVLQYAIDSVQPTSLEKCLMVGDRKYDAEGAEICGIDALGVSYGHGTRDELEAAGFITVADTPATVADILLK